MNILISGGAKNGKSYYAQTIARQMATGGQPAQGQPAQGQPAENQHLPLYYVATMIPHDEEDHARIRRHIEERAGWGFETLEQGTDLTALLRGPAGNPHAPTAATPDPAGSPHAPTAAAPDPAGVFLLDSVTALLSNEMFRPDGTIDHQAAERVAKDCAEFARATGNTVFVSDYIYSDAEKYDTITEEYRQGLALIDRTLAQVCDRVIEVSAGVIEEWKP